MALRRKAFTEQQGFTLTELLIALGIVALLSALAITSARGVPGRLAARTLAHQIAGDIRGAQQRAQVDGVSYQVAISSDGKAVVVSKSTTCAGKNWTPVVRLGRSVPDGVTATTDQGPLLFDCYGRRFTPLNPDISYSDPAASLVFTFTGGDSQQTVLVSPYSGRITIQ